MAGTVVEGGIGGVDVDSKQEIFNNRGVGGGRGDTDVGRVTSK